MKINYLIIGFVLIFLFVGLSGCVGPEVTDYFNENYEVNENTILKVTTINGQIEINNWDGDTISLNAVKKSRISREELDLVEINSIESGNQLEIEAKYVGQRTTIPTVDMNIKVPRNITIDTVKTSNGVIQISGIKGDVKSASSNGGIFIENVDGYVSATTSNGRIDIKGTTGITDLATSNGNIEVEIFDFLANISIGTSNGAITLYINSSLNANIDMTTSNGQITISDILLDLTLNEEKHKVGELGEDGNLIDIHTSNGNINLRKLEI